MIQLHVALIGNRRFRLLYDLRIKAARWNAHVPAGTETDFASVPRLFWPLIPMIGKSAPAALVHDHLYRGGKIHVAGENTKRNRHVSRKEADQAFRDIMKSCGVPRWRRFLMFWAVRCFGWLSYTPGK